MMKSLWDDRYAKTEYVYGEEPNIFFAEQLELIKPGRLILPCEGEGRNAVFSAKKGWEVFAFDSSEQGKAKALKLAKKRGATINYTIEDAAVVRYARESADVVALIYAHLPPLARRALHHRAVEWLKPGGHLILEAFHPGQLTNQSGGPKDIEMLYDEDMLLQDFTGLSTVFSGLFETSLNEGPYHQGKADVIRYVAVKV